MKLRPLICFALLLLGPLLATPTFFGLNVTAAAGGPAVAFDSSQGRFEKGASSQASPFSFVSNAGSTSGTVGSNSNRALFAIVAFRSTGYTVTAVTWNGVAMTQIGSKLAAGGGEINLFGLINPATGNQTLSATWTGGSATVTLGAVSLYNVNQTTAWQNNGTDTGTGTSASSTVTSANGNAVVVGHLNDNATTTGITTGNSNWIETALDGNYAQAYNLSTTGSTVVAWTLGTSVAWGNIKCDVIKF